MGGTLWASEPAGTRWRTHARSVRCGPQFQFRFQFFRNTGPLDVFLLNSGAGDACGWMAGTLRHYLVFEAFGRMNYMGACAAAAPCQDERRVPWF